MCGTTIPSTCGLVQRYVRVAGPTLVLRFEALKYGCIFGNRVQDGIPQKVYLDICCASVLNKNTLLIYNFLSYRCFFLLILRY